MRGPGGEFLAVVRRTSPRRRHGPSHSLLHLGSLRSASAHRVIRSSAWFALTPSSGARSSWANSRNLPGQRPRPAYSPTRRRKVLGRAIVHDLALWISKYT
jgi:hypothetical protein